MSSGQTECGQAGRGEEGAGTSGHTRGAKAGRADGPGSGPDSKRRRGAEGPGRSGKTGGGEAGRAEGPGSGPDFGRGTGLDPGLPLGAGAGAGPDSSSSDSSSLVSITSADLNFFLPPDTAGAGVETFIRFPLGSSVAGPAGRFSGTVESPVVIFLAGFLRAEGPGAGVAGVPSFLTGCVEPTTSPLPGTHFIFSLAHFTQACKSPACL